MRKSNENHVRRKRYLTAFFLIAGTALSSCSGWDGQNDLDFVIDSRGQRAALREVIRGDVSVLLFTRTDCPISNRYAPLVRRLHDEYATRGVSFLMVYTDPTENESDIRGHLADYGYPIDFVLDVQHALVKKTGAKITPEAAVFVAGVDGPQLVYGGRIDDQYVDFGVERPAPTRNDLEEVMKSLIAGQRVELRRTQAVGCTIAELPEQ